MSSGLVNKGESRGSWLLNKWPNLVFIGIPEFEILATPSEILGILGGTVLVSAYVSVHKLSGASFHKVVASEHMSTRAVAGARVQVALSPLSNSGDD